MNARVARTVSVAVLVVSAAAVVAAGAIRTMEDRPPEGVIVVAGDRNAEGVAEVLGELEQRRAAGEPLVSQGSINPADLVSMLVFLGWIAVGTMIVWRQPRNWAGWLFVLLGSLLPLLAFPQALVVYGLKVRPGAVPLVGLWAWIGEFVLYPIALLPLLFLLYPDGHLPSRRWRWAVIGLVGGTALAFVAFLLRPGPFNNWREDGILYVNPLGIDGFGAVASVLITIGAVTALVCAVSCAMGLVLRYRRSDGQERQRMRWLVVVGEIAAGAVVLTFLLTPITVLLGLDEQEMDALPIFPILFGVAGFTLVFGVPAAYLIAIFRHGLWDLNVVIRKTVVFGLVAGFITLLYVVVAVLPLAVVGSGSGDGSSLLPFAATILLVLFFQPVRQRARRYADRVVYGERATPYEVLSEFSSRLGEAYATDDVLPRTAQILANGTSGRLAVVWLRVGSELRPAATWPAEQPRAALEMRGDDLPAFDDGEHVVEVRHQGELLGALSVVMPPNDPMDPTRERMVQDLAGQAGLVLRNVRLIEELRASRQRLVAAQDEERRKLERDLHDGAQQQLVALTVQLRLARTVLDRDTAKAGEMLDALQGTAGDALEDLRDLARGIYPPLLADKGLAAALESQARKAAVPTVVENDRLGRYPRDVEATVYFCSLEALNNVAKYADATQVRIHLAHEDGHLSFEVTDDGAGFDPGTSGYGTGLQGMADRLDAIGGTLVIDSARGRGTVVRGRVPVDAAGSEPA
jgi:signal transduction histidine kinase